MWTCFRKINAGRNIRSARNVGLRITVGHNISHYRVIEKLGGGGLGLLYKAEAHLHRTVGLKSVFSKKPRTDSLAD